jgi:hypothetical protein
LCPQCGIGILRWTGGRGKLGLIATKCSRRLMRRIRRVKCRSEMLAASRAMRSSDVGPLSGQPNEA